MINFALYFISMNEGKLFRIKYFAALIVVFGLTTLGCVGQSVTSRLASIMNLQKRHLIVVMPECDSSFFPKIKHKILSKRDSVKLNRWNEYVNKVAVSNEILLRVVKWHFNEDVSIMSKKQAESIDANSETKYAILAITNVLPHINYQLNKHPYWVYKGFEGGKIDLKKLKSNDYVFPLPYQFDDRYFFNELELIASLRMIQEQFNTSLNWNFFCANYCDQIFKQLDEFGYNRGNEGLYIQEKYIIPHKCNNQEKPPHIILLDEQQSHDFFSQPIDDSSLVYLQFYVQKKFYKGNVPCIRYPARNKNLQEAGFDNSFTSANHYSLACKPVKTHKYLIVGLNAHSGRIHFAVASSERATFLQFIRFAFDWYTVKP